MSTTIVNKVISMNPETSTVGRILKTGKDFLSSLNLSISEIEYNEVFKNNPKTVMSFIKIYLRCKLINALFFCLFLFFASAAFAYSLFHIQNDKKKNASNRIGNIIAQFSFTMSLICILILGAINFNRFGFFYLSYYKGFLISFFIYTLSILIFRSYNKAVRDDDPVFELLFYCFVSFFVLSLLSMFFFFSTYFRSFTKVKLCKFTDNSQLSIYYFIGFIICQIVVLTMLF